MIMSSSWKNDSHGLNMLTNVISAALYYILFNEFGTKCKKKWRRDQFISWDHDVKAV